MGEPWVSPFEREEGAPCPRCFQPDPLDALYEDDGDTEEREGEQRG